jgi:hypothetical protein
MRPIHLTDAQKFDLALALATEFERVEILDADAIAYLIYTLEVGKIPKGKILSRTCGDDTCVNPEHLVLTDA